MIEPIHTHLACEDLLSESVLRRIIATCAPTLCVASCLPERGSSYLRSIVSGLNQAARGVPFIMLTDLDATECAPILLRDWLPRGTHPNLLFRVAVREVESWLLADRANMARFLGIRMELMPQVPDSLPDPKAGLIALAKRSPRSTIRYDLVPRIGSASRQGPGYNSSLVRFVTEVWDPQAAAKNSASLRGAVAAISGFEPSAE